MKTIELYFMIVCFFQTWENHLFCGESTEDIFHYEYVVIDGSFIDIDRKMFPNEMNNNAMERDAELVYKWIESHVTEVQAFPMVLSGSFSVDVIPKAVETHIVSKNSKMDLTINAQSVNNESLLPTKIEKINSIDFHFTSKDPRIDRSIKDTFPDFRFISGKKKIAAYFISSKNKLNKADIPMIDQVDILFFW